MEKRRLQRKQIKCTKCNNNSKPWKICFFTFLGFNFKTYWYECNSCNNRFILNYEIIEELKQKVVI